MAHPCAVLLQCPREIFLKSSLLLKPSLGQFNAWHMYGSGHNKFTPGGSTCDGGRGLGGQARHHLSDGPINGQNRLA